MNAAKMKSIIPHFLSWILVAAVAFEFVSLFGWIERAFFGQNEFFLSLLNIDSQMFFSWDVTAAFFVVLWIFSWIIWPISRLPLHTHNIQKNCGTPEKKAFSNQLAEVFHSALDKAFLTAGRRRSNSTIVMAASIALVILVTAYPYMPNLNPSGRFVGVDIPHYERQLIELDSLPNFQSILFKAFFQSRDRPLSLLLLFGGWKLTWLSARQAVQFSPILLGLFLVLSTYFFTRQAGFNEFYASLSALLTATSYHITVGMYGGLIANWISLIFLYSFLGFIFACLRKGSWRLCAIALFFQSLLLFSHANTWNMAVGILTLFFVVLLLEWLVKRENSFRPLMLLVVLIVGFSLNFLRNSVLGVALGTFEAAGVAESGISLLNIANLWQNLCFTLNVEMGISFMNPPLLFLACLGGLAVALNNKLASRFFTVSLATSSIPFVFGDKIVQTRILYNLPVHIYAIFGLLVLLNFVEKLVKDDKAKQRITVMLILLVILTNLNYALHCSFHLTQLNFFPLR